MTAEALPSSGGPRLQSPPEYGPQYDQYGGPSIEVLQRWRIYELADQPLDHYAETYETMEELGLPKGGAFVDVGCASGGGLIKMRAKYNHFGPLIGVDIHDTMFEANRQVVNEMGYNNITFHVGAGAELPINDNYADASSAQFVLYHLRNPRDGIAELQRITKHGGLVAISTSGPENKKEQRIEEARCAQYITDRFLNGRSQPSEPQPQREGTVTLPRPNRDYSTITPPPIFSSRFNTIDLQAQFPDYFEVVGWIPQKTQYTITAEDFDFKFPVYSDSIMSMKNSFGGRVFARELQAAIDDVVRKDVEREIDEHGKYTVTIDRLVLIGRNTKKVPLAA